MPNDNLEMTLEEAIDKIKWTPLYRYECDLEKEKQSDLFKALKLAVETMEKQILKKPSWVDSVPHSRCPSCHNAVVVYVDGKKLPFCHWCGQKLDWGGDNT